MNVYFSISACVPVVTRTASLFPVVPGSNERTTDNGKSKYIISYNLFLRINRMNGLVTFLAQWGNCYPIVEMIILMQTGWD